VTKSPAPAFPARLSAILWSAAVLLLLAGCASTYQRLDNMAKTDPLEPVNRVMYRINDVGDRYALRPVAKGYQKAFPRVIRMGVGHFFDNLTYPLVFVNDFLQGKPRQGSADAARFLVNTIVGLGGLFDAASELGLAPHEEDLGQTLAVWGAPAGPFLMVPLLGPRTTTHLVGWFGESYISPVSQYNNSDVRTALLALQTIHRRSTLLSVDEELRKAFDPYVFIRDAYLQNRNYQIHDGNVPEDDLIPPDEESAPPESDKEPPATDKKSAEAK
jgi:phospholipid-binding lipoprotein MlaA